MKQIHMWITDGQHKHLKDISKRTGLPMNSIIKSLLVEFIRKDDMTGGKP